MKERPILFSAPMVKAILAGKKTQTRRLVKPAPHTEVDLVEYHEPTRRWVGWKGQRHRIQIGESWACPYGKEGDRLWVRETWSTRSCLQHDGEVEGAPCTCRPVIYAATATDEERAIADGPWAPSIHMLRKDSRIELRVANVRVQRLQQIDRADAIAEGCEVGMTMEGKVNGKPGTMHFFDPIAGYAYLWNAINGKRAAWLSNPWVWAVEFVRIKP